MAVLEMIRSHGFHGILHDQYETRHIQQQNRKNGFPLVPFSIIDFAAYSDFIETNSTRKYRFAGANRYGYLVPANGEAPIRISASEDAELVLVDAAS
ncbi:hypothetical protein NAV26_03170 [Pseudomonas stutzeri]|uniref:hypothetical protein n=1 Tax=Stutzerimonas stutzeri TaxID=316 RepID=UPI0011AF7120|nr:hypothetical protein [Stutzerimonas stutzeri]MCQ4323966.1 hypothetical protein [Stutzerimonas stutzeri]